MGWKIQTPKPCKLFLWSMGQRIANPQIRVSISLIHGAKNCKPQIRVSFSLIHGAKNCKSQIQVKLTWIHGAKKFIVPISVRCALIHGARPVCKPSSKQTGFKRDSLLRASYSDHLVTVNNDDGKHCQRSSRIMGVYNRCSWVFNTLVKAVTYLELWFEWSGRIWVVVCRSVGETKSCCCCLLAELSHSLVICIDSGREVSFRGTFSLAGICFSEDVWFSGDVWFSVEGLLGGFLAGMFISAWRFC